MSNVLIAGMCDKNYWEHIAKYCVPSWKMFPYDRVIISDDKDIVSKDFATVLDQETFIDYNSNFNTKYCKKIKPFTFWKKMQGQVHAIKTYKNTHDWLLFLDTDIELFDFNKELFDIEFEKLKQSNNIWTIGNYNLGGPDVGVIVFNLKHPNIDKLLDDYVNVWESGKILELGKAYDGEAVLYTTNKYPCNKLEMSHYINGLHIYDNGLCHWCGKSAKVIRQRIDCGKTYIKNIIKEQEKQA